MIYDLGDKCPVVAKSAWIAPNACVIGQVELRARSSVSIVKKEASTDSTLSRTDPSLGAGA